jgi:YfiH family protein
MLRTTHANAIVTLQFAQLAGLPVAAHVATRHGGVSPAPWSSLNFSVLRGDAPDRVAENHTRLATALGYTRADLVTCAQVHGTGIAKVDAGDAGTKQAGSDGLFTDTPALPLGLVFGDCVPVLLYDPVRHVLGVVHAGWRGTVNGAAAALLWAMQAGYGSQPADVRACIGPSIGPVSYEVGDEVYTMAQARMPNADDLFTWPQGRAQRPHLDLWRANASQLEAEGIAPAHIEVAAIDTAQNTDDFFSHRAEQGRCGLFMMVAWLERR